MVQSDVLPKGETGGEASPSLVGGMCVLDAGFNVAKAAAFGHDIAMD